MIKKIACNPLCAILLAGVLLLGLAGCGGDEGDIESPALELAPISAVENDNKTGTPALIVSGNSPDTTLDIGGPVEVGATVEVEVNSLDPVPATVTDDTWSFSIDKVDLVEGFNTIRVIAEDTVGNQTSLSFLVEKDTTGPVVTIDQYVTPTPLGDQTLAGTTELGSSVTVAVDTSAMVGDVTVSGTTWACPVSGLVAGDNLFTVTAEDSLGNAGASVQQAIANDFDAAMVTIDAVVPLTEAQLVVTGTVASGAVPVPETVTLTLLPPAVVEPVPAAGEPSYLAAGSWQSTLTDLTSGVHVLSVGVDSAVPETAARALVVRDLVGPVVLKNSPSHGQVVDRDALPAITVTFSEDVDPVVLESVEVPSMTLIAADGEEVGGDVFYELPSNPPDPKDFRRATFTPATSLAANTLYTMIVSSGVTDTLGNLLGTSYSWQFTTAP